MRRAFFMIQQASGVRRLIVSAKKSQLSGKIPRQGMGVLVWLMLRMIQRASGVRRLTVSAKKSRLSGKFPWQGAAEAFVLRLCCVMRGICSVRKLFAGMPQRLLFCKLCPVKAMIRIIISFSAHNERKHRIVTAVCGRRASAGHDCRC